MGEYVLKLFNGEIIKKINATCVDDAISYFAKMKNLKKKQLLKIFLVEKVL